MADVSIVTEASQEANWNGQAGRQADRWMDHILSQADALTKKVTEKHWKTYNTKGDNVEAFIMGEQRKHKEATWYTWRYVQTEVHIYGWFPREILDEECKQMEFWTR